MPMKLFNSSFLCNSLNVGGGFFKSRASFVMARKEGSRGSISLILYFLMSKDDAFFFAGNYSSCYAYVFKLLLYCRIISLKYSF